MPNRSEDFNAQEAAVFEKLNMWMDTLPRKEQRSVVEFLKTVRSFLPLIEIYREDPNFPLEALTEYLLVDGDFGPPTVGKYGAN